MDELEFYDGAWTGQEIDAGIGLTGTLANALAVVVDGNKSAVSATIGQYVLVKNSTITGISDGLYIAAKALPANTTLDGTYFSSAVTAGGLNDLKAVLDDVVPVSGENYCKLPDGTLIQWGDATIESGRNNVAVTYPVPFVGNAKTRSVTAILYDTYDLSLGIRLYGLSSTTIFALYTTGNTTANRTVYWIAVGRWK